MNGAELRAQKHITKAFIDADVESLVLQRGSVVGDGAGGYRRNPPSPLPPQRVRFIPSNSSRSVSKTTLDGTIVEPDGTLFGEVGFDVAVGDTFTLWEADWEVVHVRERNAYSVKADVIRHGT